jgi:hypothetical protein
VHITHTHTHIHTHTYIHTYYVFVNDPKISGVYPDKRSKIFFIGIHFWTYQPCPRIGYFFNFWYQCGHHGIESKTDFLVGMKPIRNLVHTIEIDIRQVYTIHVRVPRVPYHVGTKVDICFRSYTSLLGTLIPKFGTKSSCGWSWDHHLPHKIEKKNDLPNLCSRKKEVKF